MYALEVAKASGIPFTMNEFENGISVISDTFQDRWIGNYARTGMYADDMTLDDIAVCRDVVAAAGR